MRKLDTYFSEEVGLFCVFYRNVISVHDVICVFATANSIIFRGNAWIAKSDFILRLKMLFPSICRQDYDNIISSFNCRIYVITTRKDGYFSVDTE